MMIVADVKMTPELKAALEEWRRTPGAIVQVPPGFKLQAMQLGVWQGIWPERKRP